MGKINEISQKVEQSFKNNKYTTEIKDDVVEFDSNGLMFNFVDPVNVPSLRINGEEIVKSEPQVQSDWNQSDSESSDFVKNKPFYENIVGELCLQVTTVNGIFYFDWGELIPVVGKRYGIEFDTDNDLNGILEQHTEFGIAEQFTQISPEGVVISFSQVTMYYSPTSFSLAGNNANGKFSGNRTVKNIRLIDYVLQKIDAKFIDGYMVSGTGDYSNKFNNISKNVASGDYSHSEGSYTTASGDYSHAEGQGTTASYFHSHAEGNRTTASGYASHSEGDGSDASGYCSHAEGYGTTASGDTSHAEGDLTIANHKSQHVFGEFNILDPSPKFSDERGNFVEIVGNGEDNITRSNARTLDWQGNEVLAGTITANGVNISEAISTVKFRVSETNIQASSDGGLTWHTLTFVD